jgi:type II secretory pathway pseudopilin PulG
MLSTMREVPGGKATMRAALLFNELGVGIRRDGDVVRFVLGVRTAWANPDDVVRRLLAVTVDQASADASGELGRSIARMAPGSLFAEDLKAGQLGLALSAAMTGVVAAVAIPAAMDYMKRTRKTEAALQLARIARNAKRNYSETSSFVVGTAAQLPRKLGIGGCCSGGGASFNHCKAVPDSFEADPVWKRLDFQIDEDSLFYYDYTGTATTFTARATGDLDCDGTEIVYTLVGKVVDGKPVVQLIEPAIDAD